MALPHLPALSLSFETFNNMPAEYSSVAMTQNHWLIIEL
jgi:hypothetical protein